MRACSILLLFVLQVRVGGSDPSAPLLPRGGGGYGAQPMRRARLDLVGGGDSACRLLQRGVKAVRQHRVCVVAKAAAVSAEAKGRGGQQLLSLAKAAVATGVCAVGARRFGALWVAEKAGQKFTARPMLYLTIPIIAGLLNWATNRLAVWMIFNPESFVGLPVIGKAREGEPLGWFGWQGIVPSKVRKMGSDIVDMTLNELLDVRVLFSRIQPAKVSDMMVRGGLLGAIANAGEESRTLPKKIIKEARMRDELLRGKDGDDSQDVEAKDTLVGAGIERQARKVLFNVISAIRRDPLKYCALKKAVVNDMEEHKMLICELFQRCGRDELRFIVDVGLWGGAALGLAQMAAWLVFTPKWSLVAGGALVGYVTDYVALKVMFEPVDPWKPKWLSKPIKAVTGNEWGGFQGLFLTRQQVVAEEFGDFMAHKVLSPAKLWAAILEPQHKTPTNQQEKELEDLLVKELRANAGLLIKGGEKGTRKLAQALRPHLMPVTECTSKYVTSRMKLQFELTRAMARMECHRFESVLHPIFQEDELTLILVGGVLGALAGFGQTFFY